MLIVPLGKKGSTGLPVFTLFVCVACIIVQVFASTQSDRLALSFYPDQLDPLKMFTSVFTHHDIWHLAGNLFFFYCFARTVETQMSILGYLLAFVAFVLVTNLAYAASANGHIPTMGLSGVVWGFMGMFLVRYPKDYIDCFVFVRTVEVPALVFILAFFAFDVVAYRQSELASVNYVAHFAGFAAGVAFKLAFWNSLTTEVPEPKRQSAAAARIARNRMARR
jgi:membrane associated rhomboid family serine protease